MVSNNMRFWRRTLFIINAIIDGTNERGQTPWPGRRIFEALERKRLFSIFSQPVLFLVPTLLKLVSTKRKREQHDLNDRLPFHFHAFLCSLAAPKRKSVFELIWSLKEAVKSSWSSWAHPVQSFDYGCLASHITYTLSVWKMSQTNYNQFKFAHLQKKQ